MKFLPMLPAVSVIAALTFLPIHANAATETLNLNQITGGLLKGTAVINQENMKDCEKKKCTDAITKSAKSPEFQKQVKNCNEKNCKLTLNVPECKQCSINVDFK